MRARAGKELGLPEPYYLFIVPALNRGIILVCIYKMVVASSRISFGAIAGWNCAWYYRG